MRVRKRTIAILIIIILSTVVFLFFPPKTWKINQITIGGDFGFTRYKFPGKGTADNPYIIRGYTLVNPERGFTFKTGIHIYGTTKHFIITECIISFFYRGIKIYNVKAGTCNLMNNTILEGGMSDSGPAHGIELMESDEVIICNNTIDAYYDAGINLHWSNNCTIEGNNIADCSRGIRILVSSNNRILKNNLERNRYGITFYKSNDSLLFDNFFNNENTNIGLNGYGNSIYKNTCLNALIGIEILSESKDFDIAFNYISNNTEGIVSECYNCSIYENNIYRNLVGIYLKRDSRDTVIYFNNFIENYPLLESNQSQAIDVGLFNIWYHPILLQGNYWSNIGTNSTYLIGGTRGSVDKYPLSSPIA
ncbi:MAG: hypothetical protein HGN29_08950 [Asgard group archaeon]|nr:hypothetical protein [Asgard group archaeon]